MDTQPTAKGMPLVIARIFPWPFVIAGVVLLVFGVRGWMRGSESYDWPKTTGEVISAKVERHSGKSKRTSGRRGRGRRSRSGPTFHAAIQYSYMVDSKSYTGERVGYGDYGSGDSREAQAIVNRYPVGREVVVYTMPSNPSECLLEPGVTGMVFLLPGIGLVVFLVGALLLVFLPRALRRSARAGSEP